MLPAATAMAQSIVPVYLDGGSEGYNDPTVTVSDITGQPSTLGQDRRDCLEAAMAVIEQYLDLSVDIRVEAQFNNLGGSANSALLGSAGPITVNRDYTGAPQSNIWYVTAEANQHFGSDLQVDDNDISSQFNSDVDGAVVLGTTTWYYGIDGNVPANHLDFFSTAMHEVCHGLGFLSLMNNSTGALFGNFLDAYTDNLRRAGATNLNYSAMNNAQRAAGNISEDELVWKGSAVVAEFGGNPLMYAPNPVEGGSSVSHWDTTNSPNLLMEPFATDAFTDLGLELQLFEDIGWPLAADPLDPNNVFVDFTGANGNGASTTPFNNLTAAIAAANSGATINIAPGDSSETFTGGSEIGVGPQALDFVINGSGTATIGDSAPDESPAVASSGSGFEKRD